MNRYFGLLFGIAALVGAYYIYKNVHGQQQPDVEAFFVHLGAQKMFEGGNISVKSGPVPFKYGGGSVNIKDRKFTLDKREANETSSYIEVTERVYVETVSDKLNNNEPVSLVITTTYAANVEKQENGDWKVVAENVLTGPESAYDE